MRSLATAATWSGVLACLCALSACSVSHEAPLPDDAGPRADASSAVDAAPIAPPPDAPVARDAPPSVDGGGDARCPRDGESPSAELEALVEDVILPGCVGAGRFCHGESYAFNMLSALQVLENLVDVEGCMGVRVVPCAPEESYVSWVIRNGGDVCGRPFPVSGRHPAASDGTYFSEADAAAIEAWIRSGAR